MNSAKLVTGPCVHRDLVEHVLHAGRELVADLPGEVLLQQPYDGEGDEQAPCLLYSVTPVAGWCHHRGTHRRRPISLPRAPDQRGLGVARGRLRVSWPFACSDAAETGGPCCRRSLGVVLTLVVVGALDIRLEEPVEGDHPPARGEDDVAPVAALAADPDRHRVADGIFICKTTCIQMPLVEAGTATRVSAGVRNRSPARCAASCASWAFLTFERIVGGAGAVRARVPGSGRRRPRRSTGRRVRSCR